MKVLIHATSMIPTPKGLVPCAKQFPNDWWGYVIGKLPQHNFIQIGRQGDWVINGCQVQFNLNNNEIKKLCNKVEHIVCIDSFLQHLLAPSLRKIIVLWSKSDPNLFGYMHNINLLKDRKYLRPDQYGVWPQC